MEQQSNVPDGLNLIDNLTVLEASLPKGNYC